MWTLLVLKCVCVCVLVSLSVGVLVSQIVTEGLCWSDTPDAGDHTKIERKMKKYSCSAFSQAFCLFLFVTRGPAPAPHLFFTQWVRLPNTSLSHTHTFEKLMTFLSPTSSLCSSVSISVSSPPLPSSYPPLSLFRALSANKFAIDQWCNQWGFEAGLYGAFDDGPTFTSAPGEVLVIILLRLLIEDIYDTVLPLLPSLHAFARVCVPRTPPWHSHNGYGLFKCGGTFWGLGRVFLLSTNMDSIRSERKKSQHDVCIHTLMHHIPMIHTYKCTSCMHTDSHPV